MWCTSQRYCEEWLINKPSDSTTRNMKLHRSCCSGLQWVIISCSEPKNIMYQTYYHLIGTTLLSFSSYWVISCSADHAIASKHNNALWTRSPIWVMRIQYSASHLQVYFHFLHTQLLTNFFLVFHPTIPLNFSKQPHSVLLCYKKKLSG